MLKPDIVASGASAGGLEVLKEVVRGLPADLNAAVFVVVHIGNGLHGRSLLAEILSAAGPVPAIHPSDGDPIREGADLCSRAGLSHDARAGSRASGVRPEREYDPAGHQPAVPLCRYCLWPTRAEIKRRGGVAVVQDPDEAVFPSMPLAALERIKVDHIISANKMASFLVTLVNTERNYTLEVDEPVEKQLVEVNCPECHGPIWEERHGGVLEYRCRVGHAYSPAALEAAQHDSVEASLWESVVALETAADMAERLSPDLGQEATEEARKKRQQAQALREMLKEFSRFKPSRQESGVTR